MTQPASLPLQHQIALVTGASSGIGYGVAEALAAAGATVVINYNREAEPAEQLAQTIRDKGGEALAIQADVSQEEDVQRMFRATIEKYGTLHILVSNSGIQQDAAFLDMTVDQWHKVIGVNLTGQFLCMREAAREFVRRGPQPDISRATGKIICMSSVHEVIPWAGHVNYAASKGGLMLLMKSVAQELAPKGIRVNSIGPGAIATPINLEARDTPQEEKDLLKLIPYGRIGEPADIGKVAVWLASDESDYVTGHTLFADGGMLLYPGFVGNG
ncbi:SDR family oxidoreductase [Hymenobacter jeollabukensis]|uniref:SDR family oxidoreductase n=1 Tax=Hymenobacter jeollabukensis TaxID=2025313 RepID=A0A5R8WPQ9_9BACT|nr:SDR family oxidoreductase [Hymenobacter jeollabukensis]TLM91850.1 SDR family oxidoreductase [Hymenobacter jeollabukensis]